MTQLASQISNGSNSPYEQLWYLIAPATGTHNVTATFSTTDAVYGHSLEAASYYNVDQTTPLGTAVTAHGPSATSGVTVGTSSANQLVFDAMIKIGRASCRERV